MTRAMRSLVLSFVVLSVAAGCRSGGAELEPQPFGAWPSPLSAEAAVSTMRGLDDPQIDAGAIYWAERRPTEAGRVVIVRWTEATGPVDVLPKGFSARTEAHGYGGGAWFVADGVVYFSNQEDQRVYRVRAGEAPAALTAEAPRDWFADFDVDRKRNRLLAVRERHPEKKSADHEPKDAIVAISLDGGAVTELFSGPDFINAPRTSPDGAYVAFIGWDHPNMPWDTTSLWQASVGEDGGLATPRLVAGGTEESVAQPRWTNDGRLLFVSDRNGWWNIYESHDGKVTARTRREAEFSSPPWSFGTKTYDVVGDRVIAGFTEGGRWQLVDIEQASVNLASAFNAISSMSADEEQVVFTGGGTNEIWSVVRVDLQTGAYTVLRRAADVSLAPKDISRAEQIRFPTTDGEFAYAFFYPPANARACGPAGKKPPLIVQAHGGPTGAAHPILSINKHYWTTRGFAVVDVNYRGSTGFGRAYRRALYGKWGKADVDDLAAAARFLAERGDIDPNHIVTSGGSAGGFTVLNALIHHPEFAAGAAYFSISDLELLAQQTHKFESRYLDQLVGPYPEAKNVYRERSPIHFVEKLTKPLVLFHGRDDRMVPVNQAELVHDALTKRGISSELHIYEGEGHGFRRAENRAAALEAELAFYRRVLGL